MKKINPLAKSLPYWRAQYRLLSGTTDETQELTFAATKAKEGLLNEPPAMIEYLMFNYL